MWTGFVTDQMIVCDLGTHVTSQPCVHTVGMDSESFNPDKIVTLKTVKDNKSYPKGQKVKLLPTSKKGVPLSDGETEVKIVTDRKRPQNVGVVKLIVRKGQLKNIKRVKLLAKRPNEKRATLVEEFDTKNLKANKGNLLKGRNPIRTKAVIIRITKKSKKRVTLKLNIKICAKTTTGNIMGVFL